MLVRLFGRNFRSLKDDFELSLVAADLKRNEDRDRGVIEVKLDGVTEPLRLLRTVAIYGSNASGKSSVLTAGAALRWLVSSSSRESNPNAEIPPYEPFLLDENSRESPIELGCDVVSDRQFLRYRISFQARAITNERLAVIEDDREIELIDRPSAGDVGGRLISESDANKLYVKEMQPNVAVLSKLAQHGPRQGNESARPYYTAILHALRYEEYTNAAAGIKLFPDAADERFADDVAYRDWIMDHLIRSADVGICDVNTRREPLELPDLMKEQFSKHNIRSRLPENRVVVSFVHDGNTNQPIDFGMESSGTKKLFNIAGDLWRLSNEPRTLLADELGASLHPRLLDRIIRSVNDATQNPSQLVFTTHETGLLESVDGRPPALRRDQVYFTKKNNQGASELYSLAEFKEGARPVHNIRKRYLSGLYGAIPSVEKLSL